MPRLVGNNLRLVLQREPDIVQPVQQTVTDEFVERKLGAETLIVTNLALLQVNRKLVAGDFPGSPKAAASRSRASTHISVGPPRTSPVSLNGQALVLVSWPLSGADPRCLTRLRRLALGHVPRRGVNGFHRVLVSGLGCDYAVSRAGVATSFGFPAALARRAMEPSDR